MGKPIHLPGTFALPFKYHAEHRHRVPKARYRITNWAEYDASLRQRGSLTIWFTDEAIQAWRAEPRTTPGGQPHYSALAISTALTWVWCLAWHCGRPRGYRLRHWIARARSRGAGPFHIEPPGQNAGAAAVTESRS